MRTKPGYENLLSLFIVKNLVFSMTGSLNPKCCSQTPVIEKDYVIVKYLIPKNTRPVLHDMFTLNAF